MNSTRDQERRTYRLTWLGFALLSAALVEVSLETLMSLFLRFDRGGFVAWLFQPGPRLWISGGVVWGSLVASYLLWGRWADPGWQRRSGLFLVMCLADAVLWLLDHGDALGLRLEAVGHDWLRANLGRALGWAELSLIAGLSCEVMTHLGVKQAAEAGRATRSLAKTGAALWLVQFVMTTDFNQPVELIPVPPADLFVQLMVLGVGMIWTVTLVQATALSIAATRQTFSVLTEMGHEDVEDDPLRSPSEAAFHAIPGFNLSPGDEPDGRRPR